MRRYVDRVVKNEICQNSDIAPKASMWFFTRLKNYKKPHGRDAEKIEAFQSKPGIFGKEDWTVEIRKSIWQDLFSAKGNHNRKRLEFVEKDCALKISNSDFKVSVCSHKSSYHYFTAIQLIILTSLVLIFRDVTKLYCKTEKIERMKRRSRLQREILVLLPYC